MLKDRYKRKEIKRPKKVAKENQNQTTSRETNPVKKVWWALADPVKKGDGARIKVDQATSSRSGRDNMNQSQTRPSNKRNEWRRVEDRPPKKP